MSIRTDHRGQTLLEVLFAMVILIVALVATIALIVSSITASRESRNRLIATSLGREAIEMARSIRDSNWVTSLEKVCQGGSNDGAVCQGDSDCDAGIDCQADAWWQGLAATAPATNPAIPVIDGSNPRTFDFSITDFNDSKAEVFLNNDFYRQGEGVGGIKSGFFRLVYMSPICHDDVGNEFIIDQASTDTCGNGSASSYSNLVGYQIISEVRWPNASSSHHITVEDRLYNWQTL